MDFNSLFFQHQVALLDLANAENVEARRWAGERADYFASGLVKERRRLGVPAATFNFRALPAAW